MKINEITPSEQIGVSPTEDEISICPYCGKEVVSKWMKDNTGCISSPEYTLVANWVYHSKCWDEQLEKFPP